ncbi:MAG: hypothetical protein QOJ98_669, partial [Acidobacteriota bacterium]|nr:hypothetical protein [Acidobacteriota bacterium]
SDGLHNLRITNIAPDPFKKNRVYASVVFGGNASGIYRSDDAGKTWAKASKVSLPEVLSLTIATEADAEVKFVAGTEKGFFYSNDAEEWTQAEPSSFPIRVDKVLRFNRNRAFAATAEGVFTTRDAGKSWYRLAGAKNRAIDIAIATLDGNKGLVAMTSAGLEVFDGTKWTTIAGAPDKGRTIAIRNIDGREHIFVAGAQGVHAGVINAERAWEATEAPHAQFASVHGGTRSSGQMLFLTSRAQREILVGEPSDGAWMELTLPTRNAEVTSVAPDPFTRERYYVGTLGEGIYVYEGKMNRYVAREKEVRAQVAPGSK